MLKILNKLERKLGRFAVKGLMIYITALNLAIFIMMMTGNGSNAVSKLGFDLGLIMKGEVWRIITYLFIPPETNVIFILFILYMYYMIGSTLESEWGSFRFNIYYLIGAVATTLAGFICGSTTALFLNTSLFLAFARINPDYEFLLFFVLPVKVKYLAWIDWGFLIFTILFGIIAMKIIAAASIINYALFFGTDIVKGAATNRQAYMRRTQYHTVIKDRAIHKCTICGITEKDKPNMDFRYCVDCEGDHEYCMDHLDSHEHIKKQ